MALNEKKYFSGLGIHVYLFHHNKNFFGSLTKICIYLLCDLPGHIYVTEMTVEIIYDMAHIGAK